MPSRLPYLVGNLKKRDVQMIPTIPIADVATDLPWLTPDQVLQDWPESPITKAQMLVIAWRIKTWKLSGSFSSLFTGTAPPGPPPVYINSVATSCAFDNVFVKIFRCADGLTATAETDLLNCFSDGSGTPVPFKFLYPSWQVDPDTSSDLTVNYHYHSEPTGTDMYDTSTSPFGTVNIHSAFVLFTDPDTFSPGIFLSGNWDSFSFGAGVSVMTNKTPVTLLADGPVHYHYLQCPGTLTIKTGGLVPDIVVPLQVTIDGGFTPGWTRSASASLDFVLTAYEYWPYSTTTGDPVYDITSGVQVADPFA
jgi:hypothetical protein